jgi:hypothetical protein
MPKVRGKYKQYLYDENIKMPDRTKRKHRTQQKFINPSIVMKTKIKFYRTIILWHNLKQLEFQFFL